MYTVYILQSEKTNRYYIGHTCALVDRISRHNRGRVTSTKHGIPWKCVYTEQYATKSQAYQRELEVKSYKGGIQFKRLFTHGEVA